MKRLFLVIVFLILLALPGWAEIDVDECAANGETWTPSYGFRDLDDCVHVPDGLGGTRKFTRVHEPVAGNSIMDCDAIEGVPKAKFNESPGDGGCGPEEGYGCGLLVQGHTYDNYAGVECRAKDGFRIGVGDNTNTWENVLFREVWAYNPWKCKTDSETTWDGPGTVGCAPSENDSAPHADAMQHRNVPNFGGWSVHQDGGWINAINARVQTSAVAGANGGVLYQNMTLGIDPSRGLADDWVADCVLRNSGNTSSGWDDSDCESFVLTDDYTGPVAWWVDNRSLIYNSHSSGTIKITGKDNVVVVKTGTIAWTAAGWPEGFAATPDGPGVMPNDGQGGLAHESTGAGDPNIYLFPALHLAVAAAETAEIEVPPFLQLSKGGHDADLDGILDADDNCTNVANAGSASCDTDEDGYGNACDGDFDQNLSVVATDFSTRFVPDFSKGFDAAPIDGTDMDCNGAVNSIDNSAKFVPSFSVGKPGPSGLACAGSAPCPDL